MRHRVTVTPLSDTGSTHCRRRHVIPQASRSRHRKSTNPVTIVALGLSSLLLRSSALELSSRSMLRLFMCTAYTGERFESHTNDVTRASDETDHTPSQLSARLERAYDSTWTRLSLAGYGEGRSTPHAPLDKRQYWRGGQTAQLARVRSSGRSEPTQLDDRRILTGRSARTAIAAAATSPAVWL